MMKTKNNHPERRRNHHDHPDTHSDSYRPEYLSPGEAFSLFPDHGLSLCGHDGSGGYYGLLSLAEGKRRAVLPGVFVVCRPGGQPGARPPSADPRWGDSGISVVSHFPHRGAGGWNLRLLPAGLPGRFRAVPAGGPPCAGGSGPSRHHRGGHLRSAAIFLCVHRAVGALHFRDPAHAHPGG